MRPLTTPGRPRRRQWHARRGYSLAALFLLLATFAVLFALIRSAWTAGGYRLSRPSVGFVAALLAGAVGGSILGGVVAYMQQPQARSAILGCGCGAAVGSLAGGVLFGGANAWVYLAGAVVLLLVSLFLHATSRS